MEKPAVSPRWRKSSYSGGAGCIEASHAPGAILIRNTQARSCECLQSSGGTSRTPSVQTTRPTNRARTPHGHR